MLESLRIIGADKAHELGLLGQNILVGIADTGIDPAYLNLHQNLVVSKDFTGDGILDRIGHGTTVAALLCSPHRDYFGVAPKAKLAVARCLDRNGGGYDYEIIEACEWLASQGVRVLNLSLGGEKPVTDNDPLCREVNSLKKRGLLVVAAAGNWGPYPMTIGPPGAASGAITVGATDKFDKLVAFSSRGPTKDQRAKPDCVAPGCDIVIPRLRKLKARLWRVSSLMPAQPMDFISLQDNFLRVSGTSFAAPLTAGGVALLLEACGDSNPSRIQSGLLDSCDPVKGELLSRHLRQRKRKDGEEMEDLPACIRLRLFLNPNRYKWGHGRINVWKALEGLT